MMFTAALWICLIAHLRIVAEEEQTYAPDITLEMKIRDARFRFAKLRLVWEDFH